MSKRKQDRIVEKAARTVAARHASTDATSRAAEARNRAGTTEGTFVVDSLPSPAVSSFSSAGVAPVGNGNPKTKGTVMAQLTRVNADRKGSSIVYSFGPGTRGTVKFARSLFGLEVPATLPENVSEWPIAPASMPKAKMTKEERAAARAAETPAQKIAAAKLRAAKAVERAAKLEASLAASL